MWFVHWVHSANVLRLKGSKKRINPQSQVQSLVSAQENNVAVLMFLIQ